jgi:hypothetical protein
VLSCKSQQRANPIITLPLLSKFFLLSNVNLVALWSDNAWMVTFKIVRKFSISFQVMYVLFHNPSFSRLILFFGAILIFLWPWAMPFTKYYTPFQYDPSLTRSATLLTTALLLHANALERRLLSCYNTCRNIRQYVLTGSAIQLLKLVCQKLTLKFKIKPLWYAFIFTIFCSYL